MENAIANTRPNARFDERMLDGNVLSLLARFSGPVVAFTAPASFSRRPFCPQRGNLFGIKDIHLVATQKKKQFCRFFQFFARINGGLKILAGHDRTVIGKQDRMMLSSDFTKS